ncbi:sensor histidine kinase [Actinacidiphila rubida]|uniref:sensor histidine kinase n=1 Tax=Actinacidiphila rubida TaxID=310780 RepID=UPI00084986D9|nr:ATP-binding protein [Actinacidiphila rubida]
MAVTGPVVAVCALACAGLGAAAPADARSWVLGVSVTCGVLLSAAAGWIATAAGRAHDLRQAQRTAESRGLELRAEAARLQQDHDAEERRAAELAAQLEAARAELARTRKEIERLSGRLSEVDADTLRLVDEAIPELMKQLDEGASAATAMAGTTKLDSAGHQKVLEVFATQLSRGERMRTATLAACANAAGRVQALSTTMLADLREMENRYDQEVLGDLLKLDHATAQAGRLADSIAVLTGGRSGRRWTRPIVMESVLRGAMSRISAYQRVRLHSTSSVAVVGHAAEGVMHALAELIDNATKFSPPTEMVHVYVEELTTGVMVTIEDAGLVMSPAALNRAQYAVSHDPLNLGTLSGTRLGLAVVGGLARKHGLSVHFRPSSRGGTGVLVLIPQQLITRLREEDAQLADTAAPAPVPASAGETSGAADRDVAGDRGADPHRRSGAAEGAVRPDAVAAPDADAAAADTDAAEDDLYVLPKRVRGLTMSEATRPQAPLEEPADVPRPRIDLGARFGEFRAANQRTDRTDPEAGDPATPSAGPADDDSTAAAEGGTAG